MLCFDHLSNADYETYSKSSLNRAFIDLPKDYKKTNFGYCPPDGNYGTIISYPWHCNKGTNGKTRVKAQYFSNPKVCHEGVPTGDDNNNNAEEMSKNRYKIQDFGTNCLDGNPTYEWKYKRNCNDGQSQFEPKIDLSKGNLLQLNDMK